MRPPIPRGVYMHGGVGRGKSFLMDCFFQAVPLTRKTRLHFHEFMREVHRELQDLKGTVNPLDELGQRIARRYPPDLLRRVPRRRRHRRDDPAPAAGGAVRQPRVDRDDSNFHPDDLYPNGLHRDRILPAIELLKDKLEVSASTTAPTTAARTLRAAAAVPPAARARGRRRDATRPSSAWPRRATKTRCCTSSSARSRARRTAGGVVWFDFKTLCGGPRSQNDYLEIAPQFHTVLLSDVPQMPPRLASEARRFTWLVDVLYDRRVKLIMSAAGAARGAVRPTGRWRTSSRAPCRA